MLIGPRIFGWDEPCIGAFLAMDFGRLDGQTGFPIRMVDPAADAHIGVNLFHEDPAIGESGAPSADTP